MVVVPSPAKILLRWIGLQRTFAGRWPSQWSRVACANVHSFSCLMRLASPNPLSLFVETYGTEQGALT